MGISCGSQIVICDLPIHFDTYKGCSHACKYCFAKKKTDIREIEKDNCIESLCRFIEGRRTQETNWYDWNIPLHWGGYE
nr:MAG TPA: Radical SAM superfamily [Caudoviricetes sp.]